MDPLVRRMSERLMTFIYAGSVDKMETVCSGDTYNPVLTKYGSMIVVEAMQTKPLTIPYGLKARAILVKKVMSLGVDLTPAFLELTGATEIDESGKIKALKPAAMLKTILASPPIDVRLHISSSSLDEFLMLIPLDVIQKSRKCDEAAKRRFEITRETELLAYGSTKVKGQVLEESLGL